METLCRQLQTVDVSKSGWRQFEYYARKGDKLTATKARLFLCCLLYRAPPVRHSSSRPVSVLPLLPRPAGPALVIQTGVSVVSPGGLSGLCFYVARQQALLVNAQQRAWTPVALLVTAQGGPGHQQFSWLPRKAGLDTSSSPAYRARRAWTPAALLVTAQGGPGHQQFYWLPRKAGLDTSSSTGYPAKRAWTPAVLLVTTQGGPGHQQHYWLPRKAGLDTSSTTGYRARQACTPAALLATAQGGPGHQQHVPVVPTANSRKTFIRPIRQSRLLPREHGSGYLVSRWPLHYNDYPTC